MSRLRWGSFVFLLFAVVFAAAMGACGSGKNGSSFGQNGPDATAGAGGGGGDDSGISFGGDGGGGPQGPLTISPANATVTVVSGQTIPTLTYVVTVSGTQVPATFTVDRGEIGSIDPNSGVFTPGGNLGGIANVTATYGSASISTNVTVLLQVTQIGDPNAGDAGAGSGGNGGVGGEGPGAAPDSGTIAVLNGTPTADPGLAWLYPYDKTVWPRGLLPPLLQWVPGAQTYDAVYIHITEASYEYKGYFAKTATPFIHHPIEQAAWQAATYSNAGEPFVVTLVFAANGKAYGPITETWKIAQGTLEGTVYYNSYGTNLAQNLCCINSVNGGTQLFGGATLGIKPGATSPVLIAGSTGGVAQCRVCHSVSANGSTLVTQHGDDYTASSAYDLTKGNAETAMTPTGSLFAFPALYPDGTLLFSNAAPLPGVNNTNPSALYSVPAGTPVTTTGLPAGLRAATPVFSPDGKHLAFNFYGGTGADQVSLASMAFDVTSNTFSGFAKLDSPAGNPDLYPSFLPTNDAVIFERETASDGEFGATRCNPFSLGCAGSRGELWWVDLATATATRLDTLNGKGYVPSASDNHTDDTTLNYEPTVNPVVSGGYAWVVFTSRRLYGNVATIDAFESDPRQYDSTTQITTKKLWVAAIDLGAAPGTDPSHPAFYLPGQELLACNSRGYWVVDPCKANGSSCLTGDECCGGYCQPSDGGFVCTTQKPPCSGIDEKCTSSGDCCGASQGVVCIDGYCAEPTPK